MDAFYASVEQRDDPALRGRPVIVGGQRPPRRGAGGVVRGAARSGVRSAMPMARALKLAPDAVVVPPRHDAYAEASEQVFDILGSVTPLVEPLSLDEAFLDVTASRAAVRRARGHRAAPARAHRRRGGAARVGRHRGGEVRRRRSPPTWPSRTASSRCRPAAARRSSPPCPCRGCGAWGRRARAPLATMGLDDDRRHRARTIRRRWCASSGPAGATCGSWRTRSIARPVIPDREAKSIGAEDTFDEDLTGVEALRAARARAGAAGRRAGCARAGPARADRAAQAEARRLHAGHPARDAGRADRRRPALYRAAAALLAREPARPTRLTGVSAQNLVAAPTPRSSACSRRPPAAAQALNRALDAIADRFGAGAVTTADVADDRRGADASALALTPTLSRKRERESDPIPSPRAAGRGLGRGAGVTARSAPPRTARGRSPTAPSRPAPRSPRR